MRNFLLLGLALIVAVLFVSCEEAYIRYDLNSLNGTRWESTTDPYLMSEVTVLEFQSTTYRHTATFIEEGEQKSYNEQGTYIYTPPTVSCNPTDEGKGFTGRIKGNTMTAGEYTFTKQ